MATTVEAGVFHPEIKEKEIEILKPEPPLVEKARHIETREQVGTGDTGANLRNVMGALVLFGVPPERFWPYDVAKFDVEPSVFIYELAARYQALKYFWVTSQAFGG